MLSFKEYSAAAILLLSLATTFQQNANAFVVTQPKQTFVRPTTTTTSSTMLNASPRKIKRGQKVETEVDKDGLAKAAVRYLMYI